MSSSLHRLYCQGRATPPKWMDSNLMLEVVMGSRAYGCNNEDSDYDIYGICIPPKEYIFPTTHGLIPGFDEIPSFRNYQEHHILDQDDKREYGFDIYNIVRFFKLAEDNNPNIIETLFVHETNVKHCTHVGRLILDNRRLFLSKLCWKKFRSFAADQFHQGKFCKPTGKRLELIQKFGFDTKFMSNVIRLMSEAEQILTEGDLNLTKNNGELKAIRRGEWTLDRVEKEFLQRKLSVEECYGRCTLPEKPDHTRLKDLLLECLEAHYGSLTKIVASLMLFSAVFVSL